jgi:oxalate decarboxylase/phosphoglucose isomerase-like protein (cupin superfamily)
MKSIKSLWFGAGLLAGAALVFAATGGASAAAENTTRILFENERVRVQEAVFHPEDRSPGMHTHEYAHVGVVIEGGTLELRSPDGSVETLNLEPGGAGYRDANVTHEGINRGDKPIRVIEVELKDCR